MEFFDSLLVNTHHYGTREELILTLTVNCVIYNRAAYWHLRRLVRRISGSNGTYTTYRYNKIAPPSKIPNNPIVNRYFFMIFLQAGSC